MTSSCVVRSPLEATLKNLGRVRIRITRRDSIEVSSQVATSGFLGFLSECALRKTTEVEKSLDMRTFFVRFLRGETSAYGLGSNKDIR